jgi:hypothetical protein
MMGEMKNNILSILRDFEWNHRIDGRAACFYCGWLQSDHKGHREKCPMAAWNKYKQYWDEEKNP